MVKYKPGTAARYGRVVFNPRWGLEYTRFPHVTRKSARVKAINVCLKAAKMGVADLKPPAQKAKEMDPEKWAQGGEAAKEVLSKAMKEVLKTCKDKRDEVCEKAAGTMGLDVDTCKELLAGINIT